MPNFTNPLAWDAKERLKYIELCAWWMGKVNRSDLAKRFSISLPQATADIQKYLVLNPRSLDYCLKVRRYQPSGTFRPIFVNPFDFESATSIFLNAQTQLDSIILPQRAGSIEKLRLILQAISLEQAIQIKYCSLNSNTTKTRKIAPHAIASDGLRWHTRAWCYENAKYRDFLPGRMEDVEILNEESPVINDSAWKSWTELQIVANPHLDEHSRRSIEMDYCMENGKLHIQSRQAMRGYTLRMLQFKEDSDAGNINTNEMLLLQGEEAME